MWITATTSSKKSLAITEGFQLVSLRVFERSLSIFVGASVFLFSIRVYIFCGVTIACMDGSMVTAVDYVRHVSLS